MLYFYGSSILEPNIEYKLHLINKVYWRGKRICHLFSGKQKFKDTTDIVWLSDSKSLVHHI